MVDIQLYRLSYHETRQSSSRRDEDNENARPDEDTPLLHRFPPQETPDRNPITTIIVTSLLSVLVLGVIIGIYLLILQNNSENILPPVDTPLQLVSRSQWDSTVSRPMLAMAPVQASQVIVVQTDTDECHSTVTCTNLLKKLQGNTTARYHQLPYNFLVSSNGQTYESLGWTKPSSMFPQHPGSMLLAFIGNFTEKWPSQEQMDEARSFFAESVSQRHLDPRYTIIGKNSTCRPDYLFEFLRSLPQWSEEWSDA